MEIVNVKKQYISKDGYEDLKDWCEDKKNIYIGRKGIVFINKERYPKENSIFCNPYKINDVTDRTQVILKYKIYLLEKIKDDKVFRKEFYKLKNKKLGCWCKPEACHGDVIIEILNTDNLMKNINIIIKLTKAKLDIYNYLGDCRGKYEDFHHKQELYDQISNDLDVNLL
jgi:hypothetical protein